MADTPDRTDIRMEVLDDIDERRFKQDEKWGPLPRRHSLDTWGMILGEEYGEFCEAALKGIVTLPPFPTPNPDVFCSRCGTGYEVRYTGDGTRLFFYVLPNGQTRYPDETLCVRCHNRLSETAGDRERPKR